MKGFILSILFLGVIAFFLFAGPFRTVEDKLLTSRIDEVREFPGADTSDVFLVVKEGTKVGTIRRVEVSKKDGFRYAAFVPDSFKVVPGQKVKLLFYGCFTTNTQTSTNFVVTIKEVLK